ncbi:MAG: hypothetical protein ACRDHE_14385 [Ktedonobacterales bacterium]
MTGPGGRCLYVRPHGDGRTTVAAFHMKADALARLEPVLQQKGHALVHDLDCRADEGQGCRCTPAIAMRPDIAASRRDYARHERRAYREWRALVARGRN